MAVQLPQFMPFQTGTQFVDNLLGLRRQGSQERQVDIMQRQADTDAGRLDLDTRRLEDVQIPEALAKIAHTEALTGHQELVSEEQEILNYFLTDEKELNLEHLDLTNETLRLQNMMLPELTQAEIGMLNAQIDKVMAETGMIDVETEFFIKTMPLREDTLELQRKLLSHDEREREQAVQEYMDLIPERIAATRASYVREGLKNEVLQSQLDTDEIIREAKLQHMDLTAKEIEALDLTNEMLAMDTEQRGAILPYETDAIIAKLKAKEQSAILQTAEDLAGLLYRDLEGEITRAALRDKAETDMLGFRRDIEQFERDMQATIAGLNLFQGAYQQPMAWAFDMTQQQLDEWKNYYRTDEGARALVHSYLEDMREVFKDEELQGLIEERVDAGFLVSFFDRIESVYPPFSKFAGAAKEFYRDIGVNWINNKITKRGHDPEQLFREDFELFLELAMEEFILEMPEMIDQKVMGPGGEFFQRRLGENFHSILGGLNIPNVDFFGMAQTAGEYGVDLSPWTGGLLPPTQPTETQTPTRHSPFGLDLTAPTGDGRPLLQPNEDLSFMRGR